MISKPKPIIKVKDISLNYGSVQALNDVSLEIRPGEIHAIVGEHGAGKSTLAKIFSGMLIPNGGEIFINDVKRTQFSLNIAQRAGIRMVYQENLLNEYFSVAENILYKSKIGTTFGFYSKKKINIHAQTYINSLGFNIDPKTKLMKLTLSERTVVEILKVLYTNPKVLILDESLEKLSAEQFSRIIPILIEKCKKGMSIITITHRIDDVYNFASNVTVLREGSLLITENIDNINKLNLIRMAYTTVGADIGIKPDTEFYQILKYNEAILQFLPMNIIVIDNHMIIKMVNEQCINSFDLRDKKFINIPLSSLLEESRVAFNLIKESVKKNESRSFYNVEIKFRDTKSINNIKTYPVFDGLAVLGTILIIEDITEYDSLQRQLILSEKLAAVGLLAAGVAHEINNPLEIISNYLSYLKYTQSNHDVIESINKVNNEITHIAKIISNLLTFSDGKTIQMEILDINTLIEEILELLKYNAQYKHINIEFLKGNEQQYISGDEGPLKQVILNLIKNSFEAMPNGGNIKIITQNGFLNGKNSSTLIFEDDGPGIPGKDIHTIFLPFYSTKVKKEDQLGLGLGLSITYRIIESFKGTMEVYNLNPKGCRFVIELPAG
ncbi:MAG: ATP-binding cassette domain-containing protein [Sphaerochaetaceae bacterium]